MFEYEVKLKTNPEMFYKLLETFSRSQTERELYEIDHYMHNDIGRFRVRETDENGVFTKTLNVKQRLEDTQLKSSKEIEVEIENTYDFKVAMKMLGFTTIGIVEKHRHQFNKFGMTINFDVVEFKKEAERTHADVQYFIEIEKVLDKQDKNMEDEILEVVDFLRIPRENIVKESYSDMLMQRYI